MKKRILIPIMLVACTLPMGNLCSCQTRSSAECYKIDGTDWEGLTRGSFAENDYIVNTTNKTVTYINGISIHASNLIIPDYVLWHNQPYKVLLGEKCFSQNSGLTGTVRLNNFIREIPDRCFLECSSLSGIICVKKLRSIGNLAFANVPLLSHIYVLQSGQLSEDWSSDINYIGDFAFYNAILLSGDIVLGSGCYYIGQYAFNNCANINTINMEFCNMLLNISEGAFAASGIKEVHFPPNLQRIENEAFRWCNELQTIHVPVKGMTLYLGQNAFFGCESLREFTDIIKVQHLGDGCFSYDTKLSFPVWEPEYGLDEISNNAFSQCGLSSLKFYPDGAKNVCSFAFADNRALNFLDFSAYTWEDGVPQWTGRHIFVGANPEGGTILLNESNRFNKEWQDFFSDNDIEIGTKWKVKTTLPPITKIIEPDTKTYDMWLTSGQGSVDLDLFNYETRDIFDESRLHIAFNLKASTGSKDAEFQLETKLDTKHKTIKFTVKTSNATHGEYIGKFSFFYEGTKISSPQSLFKIICV